MTVLQGTTTVALQYGADPASGATEDFVAPAGIWHDYLTVDGRNVAMRFCTGAAPCTTGASWRYVVTDHLGSVVAITDATDAVVERDATDPWGRPRNAATGADDPACGATPPSLTTRGFTGHERIDAICQLNANARLYDPTLGRFMAADTVISDPLNGQALNRYAYVNNRPLSLTDPSGHVPPLVPGIESRTVVGYRIPGMLDIGADGYAGLVNFGGRGTAGFSFGGWGTAVLIVPRTVTFNITGTRIPQYATVYDAFVVDFDTEQSEDSDSGDSGAAENAKGDSLSDGVYRTGQDDAGGGFIQASAITIPAWAWKAAGLEEVLGGGPEDPAADVIAGITLGIGATVLMNKIPKDAKDPNGAKAPGKPGPAEGFEDPKNGERWVKTPNGSGWVDSKGNIWVPTGQGGAAHGGPHWDVQKPGGGYDNVYPGGNVRPGG